MLTSVQAKDQPLAFDEDLRQGMAPSEAATDAGSGPEAHAPRARGGRPELEGLRPTRTVQPNPQGSPHARRGRPDLEERPLLLVDIDGVISLFSFEPGARPEGSFHSIDGIPHFLSSGAAEHLLALAPNFELVWASGWEEKANEYLPHLLGLPDLPHLSFERSVGRTNAHWKLDAIEAYAGDTRPLAWIDDAFNDACHEWAGARVGAHFARADEAGEWTHWARGTDAGALGRVAARRNNHPLIRNGVAHVRPRRDGACAVPDSGACAAVLQTRD